MVHVIDGHPGADVTIPMLEMYSTGVTLATSRVSARAIIPDVLDLIATGRLHPELVTSQVVDWTDAREALATHTHKTVVVRNDNRPALPHPGPDPRAG